VAAPHERRVMTHDAAECHFQAKGYCYTKWEPTPEARAEACMHDYAEREGGQAEGLEQEPPSF